MVLARRPCQGAGPAAWTVGQAYAVGDRVLAAGQSGQCLAAHTAQAGWDPPSVPSLWARPTPCALAPWAAQTLYAVGSQVTWGGATWTCRQAHESRSGWEPGRTPALFGRARRGMTWSRSTR